MSDSKVQISIPEELIRSMVGAAVVQQLGNPQEVAARMMSEVLLRKCRRPGGDSYGPEKPLIEWLFSAPHHRGTCRLRDALAGGTIAKREEILWAKIRGEGA